MLNFLGADFNFSTIAGRAWEGMLRFLDAEGAEFPLDGTTLSGAVEVSGTVVEIQVGQHGEGSNLALIRIPELEEGRWAYSITARAQDGGETVLCRGVVASVAVPELPEDEGAGTSWPTLVVHLPGEVAPGTVRWQNTTGAEMAAERAEAAERRTLENVELLEGAREAVEKLNGSIADAIKVSPAGTLVIGGVDTQHPVQGPPGQSGAEVQYHVIESAAQLPTDQEHCSTLHRYIVNNAGEAVVQYVWADGQWVVLSMNASTIATQTSHGYVRLGVPGGSGNMVPVVEGTDGGIYVNMPSFTEPDLYPVEGSTAVAQSGGIRHIIENRSNPVTQELLTSGGGADKCHSMGWIDLGPMWTRRMPDNVESIGLRCRPDGTGAQANAYMEVSPASDFSWGVKRSTNTQTQSPGAMCVWTFPAATNFCNGVDRVYIRLVNAAGTALPLACALYSTKLTGDTTVVRRRTSSGAIEQINKCPQMSFTGKSDLALALAGLEARVAALEAGGDAVTHAELTAGLAGKQDVPAAGKHFVVSATATGLEIESGSHTASPVDGTVYITLPSES